MLINVVLTCVVIVQALIVALVYDLYGRSAKLVELYDEANSVVNKLRHAIFAGS